MSHLTEKKISVVIPCYNEEENIAELYDRTARTLASITPHYEIIFVDNKSTDHTRSMLRELAKKDQSVVAIFFSRNFGNSQYGYTAGTNMASGDAVVWMEADLQDPPEIIKNFTEKWLEGFDVVYGVRAIYRGSWFFQFTRRMFYRIFRKASYLDIPVDAGDYSLLDRKVVNIFNEMPERSRFVRGIRSWIGFRSTGVPYERQERKGGVTSNPSFRRNLWWARKLIFSFSSSPFEFVFMSAVLCALLAPLVSVVMLYFMFISVVSVGVGILIILLLWLFACIQIGIAILSEAIGTIFEEVKKRPSYVIEEVVRASAPKGRSHGVSATSEN